MKRSVVIIAHNEESSIDACIRSILDQTYLPDEIILIAHHCTDNTIARASSYPEVTIVPLAGPMGIIYARIAGLSRATGDRIFCIDGDASAEKNWIESLDHLLSKNDEALVGSYVAYRGNLFWFCTNKFNWFASFFTDPEYVIWGPSFALGKKQCPYLMDRLAEFPDIHKKLSLKNYPDDFWFAYNFARDYAVLYTRATQVTAWTKEKNSWKSFLRSMGDNTNVSKLVRYKKSNT